MSERQTLQGKSAGISVPHRDSSGLLQRKCNSCGQHTIAGGTCGSCEKPQGMLQRKLMIGASNDPLEVEADRVADQVMAGQEPNLDGGSRTNMQPTPKENDAKTNIEFTKVNGFISKPGVGLTSTSILRRDSPPSTPSPRDPSTDESRKPPGSSLPDLGFSDAKNIQHVQNPPEKPEGNEDRLGKAGEKLAETFLETPFGKELTEKAEKFGEGFISTLPSFAVSTGIAAGTIAAMILRKQEFPLQLPVFKLAKISPSLKIKLTYKGPLNAPTDAGITFIYAPEAVKKLESGVVDSDRAETDRIAKDQAKFREGLKTPAERTAEQRQLDAWMRVRLSEPGNILRMGNFTPQRKYYELQRDAITSDNLTFAPPIVNDVLRSTGKPLDPITRSFMEPRFGHDFSRVRVHTDGRAAESAQVVNANAYTVGENVVFGAGRYTPSTHEGRRLIAHELAHVIQQDHGQRSDEGGITNECLDAQTDLAASAIDHKDSRVRIEGSAPISVARQVTPSPQIAKLSPSDITKLKAFGPSDYQESLNALQEILNKTKGFTQSGSTQQYVDIRQAAGELRAFLDYIRNPNITAVKVVPSQMGNRTPDLYLRDVAGREFRGEIVNITQASRDIRPDLGKDKQGRDVPRIPKSEPVVPGTKPSVELPTTEFKLKQIKSAITAKITPKAAGGSTQFEAQNPATQVAGRPMATGGDLVVEVLDGSASKAELDQIITDLLPKLKSSSVKRVLISIFDTANPSAGRKVFEYVRGEGDIFAGTARAAYYKPGAAGAGASKALTPAAEAPMQSAPGEKLAEPGALSPAIPGRTTAGRKSPSNIRVPVVPRASGDLTANPSKQASQLPVQPAPVQVTPSALDEPPQSSSGKVAPIVSDETGVPVKSGGVLKNIAVHAGITAGTILLGFVESYIKSKLDQKQIDRGIAAKWPAVEKQIYALFSEIASLKSKPETDKVYAAINVTVLRGRTFYGDGEHESVAQVESISVAGISATDIMVEPNDVMMQDPLVDAFNRRTEYTFSVPLWSREQERAELRAKQQAEIVQRLSRIADRQPKAPPQPSSATPSESTSLLAAPSLAPSPKIDLLPGAPGPSSADHAMRFVETSRSEMVNLLAFGEKLVMGGRPTTSQILAFRQAEEAWRLRATYAWNHFKDNGPDRARALIDEVLHADGQGGRLTIILRTLPSS